jgi:N-acetylmuramic acid 6-phosphate etherase
VTTPSDHSQSSTEQLGALPTEQRNPATTEIDRLPTLELARLLNAQDATVAAAVERALPEIAASIDLIAGRLRDGGRLIYIGAGTSGRLGVLDASECPPTFNTPPGLVVGLIAGGDHALRHPVENIEDRPQEGADALRGIDLTTKDVVVGIAASGRTPFVIGALRYARETGAATISLSNVADAAIARDADIAIAAVTGPEPVTGSTRMKAGTAQKLVLNMLSTGAMIRLGKTFGNLMVDVQPSNAKLRDRAVRIVAAATGLERDAAAGLLTRAGHDVKTAIVMQLLDLPADQARQRLERAQGVVRAVTEGAS